MPGLQRAGIVLKWGEFPVDLIIQIFETFAKLKSCWNINLVHGVINTWNSFIWPAHWNSFILNDCL